MIYSQGNRSENDVLIYNLKHLENRKCVVRAQFKTIPATGDQVVGLSGLSVVVDEILEQQISKRGDQYVCILRCDDLNYSPPQNRSPEIYPKYLEEKGYKA